MSPAEGEDKRKREHGSDTGRPDSEAASPERSEGKAEKPAESSPWGLLGAGAELGGVVALMALGGWWLDNRFHTTPWLMLAGTLVAIIGGFYNLYRQGKRYFHD